MNEESTSPDFKNIATLLKRHSTLPVRPFPLLGCDVLGRGNQCVLIFIITDTMINHISNRIIPCNKMVLVYLINTERNHTRC